MMQTDIIPTKPVANDDDSDWSDVEPIKDKVAILAGGHQEEMDEEPRGGVIRSKHEIVPQPFKEEETEEAREQRQLNLTQIEGQKQNRRTGESGCHTFVG